MHHHRPTKDAAKGMWRGILLEVGVPSAALTGKHGACPMCGGKDRFRFDNKEGSGSWFCNQCGAGDGLGLVERILDLPFPEAAKRVDAILGNVKLKADERPPEMTEERRKAALREVAKASVRVTPGDLVDVYLTSRGLGEAEYPPSLRFAKSLRDGEGGIRPAMVAIVQAADGSNCTLHRTFLRADGKGKAEMEAPRKLMPGDLPAGSAVRLSEWSGGPLGVAEGIETALAASTWFEMPVWAALTAGNLEKWAPPEGCTEVSVFGDCDASYRGQYAAYRLANALTQKHIATTVHIPPTIGQDWADVVLQHRAASRLARATA
jgi:putative DNA primase/helicase